MELFYKPFLLFLQFPPLAIGIGLVFLICSYGKSGLQWPSITAGILWVLYGIYECYMTWTWAPKHIAPIRVDLLLFAPVLYFVSLYAVVAGLYKVFSTRKK